MRIWFLGQGMIRGCWLPATSVVSKYQIAGNSLAPIKAVVKANFVISSHNHDWVGLARKIFLFPGFINDLDRLIPFMPFSPLSPPTFL